jgi:hypothetical protein
MSKTRPDLHLLDDVVAQRILDAAHEASKKLKAAGVRHALIGGLAVGAYGYPRATKDVDFLMGDEGFEHHGPLISFKYGMPISVNGVAVDLLPADILDKELDSVKTSGGIPIVEPEVLIYMKLKANRRRDQQDVVALLRAGLDRRKVRAYLERMAKAYGATEDYVARFDEFDAEADEGE